MKIKSLFIAVLVVISSATAFAGKDEPRKTGLAIVPVKGNEVFKVVYKGENIGRVKLNVYGSTGSIVFSETIYGVNGFIRPLNFSGLSAGEYTIELIDDSGKRTEKVLYQPKSNITYIHVSKISAEEGKYLVAIANTGNEVVNLNIFDGNNNLVHTESRSISGDFAQVYKLENASSSYTFELTDKTGHTKAIKF
jgi:hypothetical protein